MSKRQSGLGNGLESLGLSGGLDSLINDTNVVDENKKNENGDSIYQNVLAGFVELPISLIYPNESQPRKEFDEIALENLAQSIRNFGLIQPITVVRLEEEKFEIVAGERRYRACKKAGLENIPVIIKNISQREKFEMAVVENVQREDLNPIEESLAYSSLIDSYDITQEELGSRLGKSRTSITNALRLLNLDPQIQKWIIDKKVTPGHARAILSINDKLEQLNFADYIIKNNLSVREAEKVSKNWKAKDNNDKKKESNNQTSVQEIEIRKAKEMLEEKLKTKIDITGNSKKGKISINYFNIEELERILNMFDINFD